MPRTLDLASALVFIGASTLLASSALAQDAKLYDWPDETAPVLISSGKGLVFLHQDGKPYRAYDFKASKKGGVIVTDLDEDGKPEIVGAGKPTFTLDTNTSAMFSRKQGCGQVIVADFIGDKKLELMCSDGGTMRVFTYDGQMAWEINVGRSFGTCKVGDVNGDLHPDIECTRGKKIVRFDAEGKLMDGAADSSQIEGESETYTATAGVDLSAIEGKAKQDLTGDGKNEAIEVLDGSLVVRGEDDKILSTTKLNGKPVAALVKNLDGKGASDIIVVTDKTIHVIDPLGKASATYSLSARSYKRAPTVEYQGLSASNFSDEKAAREAAEKVKDKLAKCYTSEMKKSEFAGSGQLLTNVFVDAKGKITGVQAFTNLASPSVPKCVKGTLKKLKLPAATGDKATLTVTLKFDFRDR